MPRIVGVAFNKKSRVYNFDSNYLDLNLGDNVIVETEKGLQFGTIVSEPRDIKENEFNYPLKKVIRDASKKDEQTNSKNNQDAGKALIKAREIVQELGLDMNILDASFTFDRKQLLFNFLADDRIDFRELAKKLAAIYKTRIELRQIGVRDKAKEIGGLGPCGRMLCCNSFLTDLNSVTINMAKNQLLALNPTKINGSCGRLLCCLAYEDVVYTKLRETLPDIGDVYKDKNISGKVVYLDILGQKIYVEDSQKEVHIIEVSNGNNK
jgi:cell fate regulator YaaT (PSP1 superfamily)